MEEITPAQAALDGVRTAHHRMDNGESRYRLIGGDGASYIRTQATADGGWQRSHFHTHAQEMYIVQQGWMDVARPGDGAAALTRYAQGEHVCICPGDEHNIRMGPGAVVHTVKYGAIAADDWHAAPALDALIAATEP